MRKELITLQELEAAAHRQGFPSLKQVDSAVLEPSGLITFVGKEPPPAEVLRRELTSRLDQIGRQLAEVQAAIAAR
jgi:uncharacterized membrane protein YcaP (DUF421 family)